MPWQCQVLALLFVLRKNPRLQRRMRQRKKMRRWRVLFTSLLAGEKSQSLDAIRITLPLLVLTRPSWEGPQSLSTVKITSLLLTKWRMKPRWMLHSSLCARSGEASCHQIVRKSKNEAVGCRLPCCMSGRSHEASVKPMLHVAISCFFCVPVLGGMKCITCVDLHRTILQNLSHTNLNQQFSWTKGLTELQYNKLLICLIRDFCSHYVMGNSCTLISSYN